MGKKYKKGVLRICPRTRKRMYDEQSARKVVKSNQSGISAYYLCTACGEHHLTSSGTGYKGEIMP